MTDPAPPATRPVRVAVCGPGEATDAETALAEEIGRLIAEHGWTLVCGGLGGVMAAACRGANRAGGATIGIIPGYDEAAANPWVAHVICTGLGQARNTLIAATGHTLIAVGGGYGTLSEIALALRLRRPVILLGGWTALLADTTQPSITQSADALTVVESPADAIAAVARLILRARDAGPP